jgi:hypothetical protein
VEIDQGCIIAANLDGIYHIVGVAQCFTAIQGRGDRRRRRQLGGQPLRHEPRGIETNRIDVHERDVAAGELGKAQDVTNQVLREDHATRTNQSDLCHCSAYPRPNLDARAHAHTRIGHRVPSRAISDTLRLDS